LRADRTLSFVDFEYAGWDDPAKLICDFSCQPERPITTEQAEQFSNTMATWLNSCDLMVRAENLTPLYRVKWCCILLNEYLQEGRDRRMHSNSSQLNLKEMQLSKAKRYFCQHLGSS
jgi:thiamine kinase-like enzyme